MNGKLLSNISNVYNNKKKKEHELNSSSYRILEGQSS